MAKLAATVTEPVFGTTAGEWTVLCLARGGYYARDNAYFTGYYDRFINNKKALFDYSDVTFDAAPETDEMTAILGVPEKINEGDSFNAVISINKWDNEAGYKLIDFIVNVPAGVTVTGVTASDRLAGGELSWNLEAETGKLRVVCFDANENTTLTITVEEFPAELFTIGFKAENVTGGSKLSIALSGMSVKLTSDSEDEASMIVVNTDSAKGTVDVVVGISFSAVCPYTGDDVDLISATRKAVAVAVTGISNGAKLSYNDGTNAVEFKYSAEITAKTGVSTYAAIVDEAIAMENFVNESYFSIPGGSAGAVTFGDTNGDGIINAQDALAVVDAWLRKGGEPNDDQILTMNVNGDSRINAGKSTTLKVISGLRAAYRGDVRLQGKLGHLPQNPQTLFVKRTVREDLYEVFRGEKISREIQDTEVARIVELCGLREFLDRHPYDISGGEQQRTALAKVLLTAPDILLLHEPTKGFDAEFKVIFALILRRLVAQGGNRV